MRIKYTIYWFEDKNDWLNQKSVIDGILQIIKYLEEHLGFQIEITFFVEQDLSGTRDFRLKKLLDDYPEKYKIQKLDNYTNVNLKKIIFHNVDLVLMDYNLGSEKGNDVIDYIRDNRNDVYTDILFYSQDESEEELRKKSDRDGLYCSERSELFSGDKINKVIKTTIRKVQDLNNLRGLVMAETSELDSLIKQILVLIVLKGKVSKERISEKYEKMLKKSKENSAEVEAHTIPADFVKLTETRHFTSGTSYDFLYHFSKDSINDMDKKILLPYKGEIIEERNNLAHNPEDSSTPDKMIIIKKGKSLEYDEKKFIKIRKDIQKYKQTFQEIINSLK
ncbi:hypothetical protein KAR26_01510 [Candidatus Parcubacteria bacterium]|nr:hypothetical protein [Candidatus Parcubacteria bacterium]